MSNKMTNRFFDLPTDVMVLIAEKVQSGCQKTFDEEFEHHQLKHQQQHEDVEIEEDASSKCESGFDLSKAIDLLMYCKYSQRIEQGGNRDEYMEFIFDEMGGFTN